MWSVFPVPCVIGCDTTNLSSLRILICLWNLVCLSQTSKLCLPWFRHFAFLLVFSPAIPSFCRVLCSLAILIPACFLVYHYEFAHIKPDCMDSDSCYGCSLWIWFIYLFSFWKSLKLWKAIVWKTAALKCPYLIFRDCTHTHTHTQGAHCMHSCLFL